MLALLALTAAALLPQSTVEHGVRARPLGDRAPSPAGGGTVGRPDPDVLIIVGDDFNWDDLASIDAPHVADLAHRGMTFRNAYSFPQCSTTRYSLVFGRYPRRDGIGALVGMAPPDPEHAAPTLGLPTLPSMLRASRRTYFQSALIGKWHLGTSWLYDGDPAPDEGRVDLGALTPVLHGFDRFLAGTMSNLPGSNEEGDYFHWERVDDGVYSSSTTYAARAQLDAFTAWWTTTPHRIAVLAPNLAHAPHQTPPAEWLPAGYPTPQGHRATFEAMLVGFDTFVGRVMEEVDLARTYVILFADNGTQPSISITPCSPFAGPVCTKTTTWQGGIHVPFFVAGPGIAPGSTTDAPVSTVDIMATLGELLGVPSPGEDSISFAPALFDPAARTRRIAYSETFGDFGTFGEPAYRTERAAIGERYKLRELDGVEFLFDLVADPRENVRLSTADPALASVVAQLRAVLADPLDRTLQQ